MTRARCNIARISPRKASRALDALRAACIATLLMFTCTVRAQPQRVLILDQGDLMRPFLIEHTMAIRAALTQDAAESIETYTEGLDIDRFPGPEHKKQLTRWLKEKYGERTIDAIIAEGPDALDFAVAFRPNLNPAIPIVFTSVEDYYIKRMALPPGVTGVASVSSFKDSILQAIKMVPGTNTVVLLGDVGSEGSYLVDVMRQLAEIQSILTLNVMTGMPIPELLSRVSALPKNSVIMYLGITHDAGQYFLPRELLSNITRTANRPVFVTSDALMGAGTVGGVVTPSSDGAHEVADMVRRILKGEDASALPVLYRDSRQPLYDATVLKRWDIPREGLPSNSLFINDDPSLWQKYSIQIAVIALVIALEGILIVALVVERRRRHAAELRFRRSMSDFSHITRTTALGELSASIAHELNQPLAAILTNAEAAEALMESDPIPLNEIRGALADIRRDDQRASGILASVRAMVKKHDPVLGMVDITEVIDEILPFVAWESRSKNVQIIVECDKDLPLVTGNEVQLSQIILNLLMNGIEAVNRRAEGERIVRIGVRLSAPKAIHVYVEDNGHGIPPDMLEHIFDPYYTTKDHGLGMGLSISRTIVEAHGGRLVAENNASGGACFSFTLPGANTH